MSEKISSIGFDKKVSLLEKSALLDFNNCSASVNGNFCRTFDSNTSDLNFWISDMVPVHGYYVYSMSIVISSPTSAKYIFHSSDYRTYGVYVSNGFSLNRSIINSSNDVELDFSGLSAGTYFLKVCIFDLASV